MDAPSLRGTGLFGSVKQVDIDCKPVFPPSGGSRVYDSASAKALAWCEGKWVVFGLARRQFLGADETITVLGLWVYDEALRLARWIEVESPLSSDPRTVVCTRQGVICVTSYAHGPGGIIHAARVLRLRGVSLNGEILDEWELPNRPSHVSLAREGDDFYIAGGVVNREYDEIVSQIWESTATASERLARLDELRNRMPIHKGCSVERLTRGVPEPVLQTNGWITDFAVHDQRLLISFAGSDGDPRAGRLALYTREGELLIEREAGEALTFAGARMALRR